MTLSKAQERARAVVADELRKTARNLEDMYGRILGMTAFYDSIRDRADSIQKGHRTEEIDSLITRTRNELLDEIEAGMPRAIKDEEKRPKKENANRYHEVQGYELYRTAMLNRLKSFRD